MRIQRQCEGCGTTFEAAASEVKRGNARFCSLKCSNSRPRKNKTHNSKCAACGETFYRMPSKRKLPFLFCCRACKDNAQRIDSGISFRRPSHYSTGITHYRAKAFRHYGKTCADCGYDKHEQMLDVHHIDRNRKHNKLENLVVLCVWCHALRTRKIPAHSRNGPVIQRENATLAR